MVGHLELASLWIHGLDPRVVTSEEIEEILEEIPKIVAADVRDI